MSKEEMVKTILEYEPDRPKTLLQRLSTETLQNMLMICEQQFSNAVREQLIESGI